MNATEESPGNSPPRRHLRQFLTYRIARLHIALNAQAQAILDRHGGIGLAGWRVLSTIVSLGADSATAVVRMTGIDPAIVSRTLRQLEEDGLVATARDDGDRRLRRIGATAQGLEVFRRVVPHMERRQNALLDSLKPGEREAIFGILDKLELAAETREFPE